MRLVLDTGASTEVFVELGYTSLQGRGHYRHALHSRPRREAYLPNPRDTLRVPRPSDERLPRSCHDLSEAEGLGWFNFDDI